MQNQAIKFASGENGQPQMYCLEELPSHSIHGIVVFETFNISQRESYLGLLDIDLTMIEQLAVQKISGGEIVSNGILSDALVGRRSLR